MLVGHQPCSTCRGWASVAYTTGRPTRLSLPYRADYEWRSRVTDHKVVETRRFHDNPNTPPRQKVSPMPTTTTHSYPSVAPPTGVAAFFDWRPNDPLPYRVVLGANRGVTDHKVVVQTSAIQFADGHIDDGGIVAPIGFVGLLATPMINVP
jgi:hypothetical protein